MQHPNEPLGRVAVVNATVLDGAKEASTIPEKYPEGYRLAHSAEPGLP